MEADKDGDRNSFHEACVQMNLLNLQAGLGQPPEKLKQESHHQRQHQ